MANLVFLVPVLLLATFVRTGDSIRCWSCSSDVDPSCNDPFLPGGAGRFEPEYGSYNQYQQYNTHNIANCDSHAGGSYPFLTSSRSVCKKHKKYVNGILSVFRGCSWKRVDDYSTSCTQQPSSGEQTVFCETCDYDGCNGAATIGKTIALLLTPVILALFK